MGAAIQPIREPACMSEAKNAAQPANDPVKESKTYSVEHGKKEEPTFMPVSPLVLRPNTRGHFAIYLKQGSKLVLYTKQGQDFTPQHREKLFDMGVKQVYVPYKHKEAYDNYLQNNLGKLLDDESLPLRDRTGALYAASMTTVKEVFHDKLPQPLNAEGFERIKKLVSDSTKFFANAKALKHVAEFVSENLNIYNHSVNVMVMSSFLLQSMRDKVDHDLLVKCGIGAMLHDFGKCKLPRKIVEKTPEKRSPKEEEEYKTHPNLGVAMCANVNLAQETIHCVLFHHEHEDGSGYPSALTSEDIPFYVKALSVCNVYDNLTTPRQTGKHAKTPFEALMSMRARQTYFDQAMLRKLIMLLAKAEIVDTERVEDHI